MNYPASRPMTSVRLMSISTDIVYRVGRALTQHLAAKTVVIGYDARETSPPLPMQ